MASYYNFNSTFPTPELIVLEVYDSDKKNLKVPRNESFLYDVPFVISSTFIPFLEIDKLGFSKTRFGITTKEFYFTNFQKIFSIPRSLIDPLNESNTVKSYIDFNPLNVVFNGQDKESFDYFTSTPSVFESTSVMNAIGNTNFTWNASPSGKFDVLSSDFNKSGLVVVVLVLCFAVVILKRLVFKKQVADAWK